MKKIMLFIFLASLLFSCGKNSQISDEFDCGSDFFSSTEKITDVKDLFSVEFPKNWKTNLYFDDGQSSIFGADTTKQLTQTFLLDVSFIKQDVLFDEYFKLNLERENLSEERITIKKVNTKFNKKEAYYSLSVGKKGDFDFHLLDYYIKVNDKGFIHTKTQIYGDSLVNERLCKSINLIHKIKIN